MLPAWLRADCLRVSLSDPRVIRREGWACPRPYQNGSGCWVLECELRRQAGAVHLPAWWAASSQRVCCPSLKAILKEPFAAAAKARVRRNELESGRSGAQVGMPERGGPVPRFYQLSFGIPSSSVCTYFRAGTLGSAEISRVVTGFEGGRRGEPAHLRCGRERRLVGGWRVDRLLRRTKPVSGSDRELSRARDVSAITSALPIDWSSRLGQQA